MIFAVCNPDNSAEAQICLALQILCGFSIEEIANAFLTRPETIKKRLHRARVKLRNENFRIKDLSETEIKTRSDTVLKTLYLLFNEGYFSKTSNQLIRRDLCSEAVRLTYILTENRLTNSAQAAALLALMCFQSSRLDARVSPDGEAVLFEDQNENLWNSELIEKGNQYLEVACSGDTFSKYHLEAAIAHWHTRQTGSDKWPPVLQLYNELILMEYSPVTALNRAFAFAKVHGYETGIREAEKLNLNGDSNYHSLLGYLYADSDPEKSVNHYKQAVRLTKSAIEKQTLRKEIERLKQ